MTAKKWLSRIRRLDKEINALELAKQQVYARCVSGVPQLRTVPISGGEEKRPLESYAELSVDIDRQIDLLHTIETEVLRVIELVPSTTFRCLLTLYYVHGYTWREVAAKMNYSYAHVVQRLHPGALEAVELILGAKDDT